MLTLKKIFRSIGVSILVTGIFSGCGGESEIEETRDFLNVSYDPTRELFAAYNDRFGEHWHETTGEVMLFMNSHGGSGDQALKVIEGLEADVVTLALAYDVDEIQQAGLIEEGWIEEFPDNSAPYTSTIVFLVRNGNPKNIRDWDDLIRDDVKIVTPNPKTSGGARWNYLAAWEYARRKFDGNEDAIKSFMRQIFNNVVALDTGARGSTRSFVEKEQGDVLIAWESEALLTMRDHSTEFEIVVPSVSILTEPSVAVVDKIVDSRGTRNVAEEYIRYLYSPEGQEIAARNFYRPRDPSVAARYESIFKPLNLITIDEAFGGWENAQQIHFASGGIFDEIYHH